MNIALLIQDNTTDGGTERTTCALASELACHGHMVTIVSCFQYNPTPRFVPTDNVRTEYLSTIRYSIEMSNTKRGQIVANMIWRVRKCKALQGADVIICQKVMASLLSTLAGFREKSIACEHFRFKMYTPLVRLLRNRLYRCMHHLVVLTENDRKQFADKVPHTTVIENMVPIARHDIYDKESKRIISAGRLTPQKGYDLLLDALALISDELNGWHVDIYGDGPERENLIAQRDKLGLEGKVSFCGFSPRLSEEMKHAAFYVLSSRFEGFVMVLLEAAACSLPIIAFDCPEGVRQLLLPNHGLVAERENTADLAEKIRTMILNPELRIALSAQSHTTIEPYLPQTIYEKWHTLITPLARTHIQNTHLT